VNADVKITIRTGAVRIAIPDISLNNFGKQRWISIGEFRGTNVTYASYGVDVAEGDQPRLNPQPCSSLPTGPIRVYSDRSSS
jgi:hypothetical protein